MNGTRFYQLVAALAVLGTVGFWSVLGMLVTDALSNVNIIDVIVSGL